MNTTARIERLFVGWEQPAVESVACHLLQMEAEDPHDFRKALVVVPTAQSGRFLRLELARQAGRPIMLPDICLSGQLIPAIGAATPADTLAAWVKVLAGETERPALFPVRPAKNRETWALETAQQMLHLRAMLEESDLTPHSVIRRVAGLSEELAAREIPRWQELEMLFAEVDTTLEQEWGVRPAERVRERAMHRPELQQKTVILACVPAVSAQSRRYLAACGSVRVLINAPEETAEMFDAFGQPGEAWCDAPLPLADSALHSVATGAEFAEETLRLMQQAGDSREVIAAVCDRRFEASLRSACTTAGWPMALPQGRTYAATAEGNLPRLLLQACAAPQEAAPLLPLLRSPLMLRAYSALSPYALNKLLDDVEKRHYPARVTRLQEVLKQVSDNPAVARYADTVIALVTQMAQEDGFAAAALELAKRLEPVADRRLVSALRDTAALAERHGDTFGSYAAALPLLSAQLSRIFLPDTEAASAPLTARGWLELGFAKGSHLILTGMHEGCVPVLPEPSSFLPDSLKRSLGMVCNKTRVARDAFLLSALLHRQGMKTDVVLARQLPDGTPVAASRLLMHVPEGQGAEMVAQRVAKLFGETENAAAPVLNRRGGWYIGAGGSAGSDPAHEPVSVIAGARRNPWGDEEGAERAFSPSQINMFLQAPLEFWCKYLLGINMGDAYQENKSAMELNEYGTLLHDVLRHTAEEVNRQNRRNAVEARREATTQLKPVLNQLFADDENLMQAVMLRTVTGVVEQNLLEPADIRRCAAAHLERLFAERFGNEQTLPLLTQRRMMQTKLNQWAVDYATDWREGWRTLWCEKEIGVNGASGWRLDGEIPFRMVIDRVDINEKDGRVRVVDYKTNSKTPAEAHWESMSNERKRQRFRALMPDFPLIEIEQNKRSYHRAWVNVQLPLYAACVKDLLHLDTMPEIGYYNLPKNRDRAGYSPFIITPETMENALTWVKRAAALIRAGVCLVSAQSLGRKSYQEFGALLTLQDTRSLFNLPPLSVPPPETVAESLYTFPFNSVEKLIHEDK